MKSQKVSKRTKALIFCVCLVLSGGFVPDAGSGSGHVAEMQKGYYLFKWQWEPNEKAFRVLIPDKWIVEGGIFRINPVTGGGAGNAIEAKLDFTIKSDTRGQVMMRWFPDMFYFDPSYSPAGQMGLIRPGTNYNGMMVSQLMLASRFIAEVVFPYAHSNASGVVVRDQRSLPELAKAVAMEDKSIVDLGFTYTAAMVHFEYTEGGVLYEEKIVAAITSLGQAGAGMWKNRYTFSIRAPKGKLQEYEPIFGAIGNSVTMNNSWMASEIKGQMERSGILNRTMAEINRIGQEIANHRNKINSSIQNDMYLTLTGQEEYVNPYSGETEIGTNKWNHRWSSNSDFVIYSDDPNFDPNRVPELNHFEYRKSQVKSR
jgi:hypothetical protein